MALVEFQTLNGPRKIRVCDYCKTVCIPSGRFCSGHCARGFVEREQYEKKRERQRALIDACNLLCEFASEQLPEGGWELVLTMRRGESEAALIDPSGKEIETDSPDSGISTLEWMCDTAREIQNSRNETA